MSHQLQVLVVDDSALMRKLITNLLESDPGVRVVGTASDGVEALQQIAALHPDVVTLDVEMPRMSGLEALEQIMRDMPLPVVMLSGLSAPEVTLTALELGAVDFILKPSGTISVDLYKIRDTLLSKVKIATFADVTKLARRTSLSSKAMPSPPTRTYPPSKTNSGAQRLVVIAASTGGPRALDSLVQKLPGRLAAAVLIVQHMPKGFTASLAKRLNGRCELEVKEAEEGEAIEKNRVYIAPAGHHLLINPIRASKQAQLHLDNSPPVMGLRPAADLLMESAAPIYGPECIGIVLTGMGSDGTKGIKAIKEHGGQTIVQDRASSTIYGMPRSAIESGYADQVLPLDEIVPAVVQLLRQR